MIPFFPDREGERASARGGGTPPDTCGSRCREVRIDCESPFCSRGRGSASENRKGRNYVSLFINTLDRCDRTQLVSGRPEHPGCPVLPDKCDLFWESRADIWTFSRMHHTLRIRDKKLGGRTVRMELREQVRAMHEAKAEKSSRENRGFVQVYPQGWQRIRSLMSENPTAAKGLCSARRAYRPVLRGGGRQSGRSGGNGRRVREDHQEGDSIPRGGAGVGPHTGERIRLCLRTGPEKRSGARGTARKSKPRS